MMMALGQFCFGLSTLAYQELQRQSAWRHASNSRVGTRAAHQFVGVGDETINLTGILLPELFGSPTALLELRTMGDRGEAWPLVDGAGNVYGSYVIESLNETGTVHIAEGLARRTEFHLCLKCVDDRNRDMIGNRAPSQPGMASEPDNLDVIDTAELDVWSDL